MRAQSPDDLTRESNAGRSGAFLEWRPHRRRNAISSVAEMVVPVILGGGSRRP